MLARRREDSFRTILLRSYRALLWEKEMTRNEIKRCLSGVLSIIDYGPTGRRPLGSGHKCEFNRDSSFIDDGRLYDVKRSVGFSLQKPLNLC